MIYIFRWITVKDQENGLVNFYFFLKMQNLSLN